MVAVFHFIAEILAIPVFVQSRRVTENQVPFSDLSKEVLSLAFGVLPRSDFKTQLNLYNRRILHLGVKLTLS